MYEGIPDLMTRKEAQSILKVGKNTMLNYIHQGLIPAKIVANSYRITKKDLIEFVEKSAYYK